MAILRRTFAVEPLGCNCTIVACPDTHEAIVIDPGEAPRILRELAALGVTAVRIIHTHAHFDHVLGTDEVAAATGAEVALHTDDRWLYDHVPVQLEAFGMLTPSRATVSSGGSAARREPPLRELVGGEVLPFGRREARALHTPGHTPGSLCFFIETSGERPLLFSGDTLFAGSIGRTDLWGGDPAAIVRSIQGPLWELPDDTLVVPGHGSETSIGLEREDNPFVGRFARS